MADEIKNDGGQTKTYTIQEAHADKFGHFNGVQDEVGGKLDKVTKAKADYVAKLDKVRADETLAPHFAKVETAYGTYADAIAKDEKGAFKMQESNKKLFELDEKFKQQALDTIEKEKGLAEEARTFGKAKNAEEAFGHLHTKLTTAREALDGAIAKSESAVAKEFVEAQKGAAKFGSIITGQVHARGFGAISDNFKHASNPIRFARGASTLLGGYMMIDALRSKTSDGQDRSWVTRVGEGAIGAAAAFGGLAGGKARL